MNSPPHPFPGQNDIHDDGHYPEQTNDVRDAIIHYRNDPRSNGEVVVIGGSAGGSHSLYLAATGTPGNDMPDLAVTSLMRYLKSRRPESIHARLR